MGDIPEIVWQGGAAVVIVTVVLTKFIEIVKFFIGHKESHSSTERPIYVAQPEMCKVQHEQINKASEDHKTEADKNWRDAFDLLRKIDGKLKT